MNRDANNMKSMYISKYLQNRNTDGYELEQGIEMKDHTFAQKDVYKSKYLDWKRSGLNKYFSFNNENYDTQNEVDLVKRLQQELIQIYGYNVTYIIRESNTHDHVYGESIGTNFSASFRIEMMPETPEGMLGRDSIMPYGYAMTDTVVLYVSFDRLIEEIKKLGIDRTYPDAGDLIAWDMPGNIMEINYVEDKVIPFVKGTWTMYALHCQVFNLGQEKFTTGDENVDFLNEFEKTYEYPNSDNHAIQREANSVIMNEPNIWKLDFQKNIKF